MTVADIRDCEMSAKYLVMLDALINADVHSLRLMLQAMTSRDYKMLVYFLQHFLKGEYSSLLHVLLLPRAYTQFARRISECRSSVKGRKMLLREGAPEVMKILLTPVLDFLRDNMEKIQHSVGPLSWIREELKCPKCAKVFCRRDHLGKHQNVHMSCEKLPFTCPSCPKRFCSLCAVRKHTARCHGPLIAARSNRPRYR